jgi:hypothetical protein
MLNLFYILIFFYPQVGPKLIFSFTVAQQLIPIFHKSFEANGITKKAIA